MKFSKTVALALAAGVIASAAYADEEAPSIGGYAGTVLKNGYLSNGYLFADETVLQSYAGVTYAGFDLNIWNSWAPGESHFTSADASNEIDYELDYGNSIGDFDYSLGVAAWCYPNSDDSFDDWVGKVAIGYNGWVVRPEVNARFGLDGAQGCYGQFKLSKGFDLSEDVAQGLSAKVYGLIAYASKSYRAGKGVDDDGFVDAEFGASVTYELCPNASVSVGCQYAVVVDSELRDAIEDGTAFMADGETDHFMYYAGVDVWF